jgi:peroxiredoxin
MTARNFLSHGISVIVLSALFINQLTAEEINKDKDKNNLTIEIDLSKLSYEGEKIFFTYYNSLTKERHTDSADFQKKVIFKAVVAEPILAQLTLKPKVTPSADGQRRVNATDNFSIYIEKGTIKVKAIDSLKKSEVKGSSTHKDYKVLQAALLPYQEQLNTLYAKSSVYRKEENEAGLNQVRTDITTVNNAIKEEVYKGYITGKGKNSPVAIYALSQYAGYAIDADKVEPLYLQISPSIRELPSGKLYESKIATARQLEIGKSAIDFTQNDTADIPVSLSSFKGQYVLVDFWASWCGPCRAENPNVVKAFQKYKDNDFTVLGISLDRPGQKDKWIQAIHDDQLTWTHISDLKFWNNEIALLYDIKAIPQNLLLDKEGKIIAKNIRGEDLEQTLSQIFDKE